MNYNEMKKKIAELELQIKTIESFINVQPIGEVYGYKDNYELTLVFYYKADKCIWKDNRPPQWFTFTKKDVQDLHDGFVKIGGSWFPKEDVIFYNEIDEKKKSYVERKYKEKKETK